jgi:hypothetical protein
VKLNTHVVISAGLKKLKVTICRSSLKIISLSYLFDSYIAPSSEKVITYDALII